MLVAVVVVVVVVVVVAAVSGAAYKKILMIKKAGGLIFDPTTVASKRGCPSFEVVPYCSRMQQSPTPDLFFHNEMTREPKFRIKIAYQTK